ncbi:MAG: hypothetical protein COY55_08820 [Flavobacteriaceae bacterium CG_4_10_14_0_8_um_filter_31_99]|nr:MAG: hypothetical protein COW43_03810 [Flavobacteriaceae bacterium CG17_big_fil_post_rev_8_21_14_2_50_31_13]PIX12908.1 MAG: hypothetical protein COZ74_09075 [Flavobacteriaceae bacterium CG_4_8_14_3_um_filter_31_8]PIZ10378.1 MAG: hypothetical protein COY55_08820 [Flavobacteriaceae bacterium CG_4_10_14_0_8_um_filter_31_99]
MNVKLSIGIPTYNQGSYLEKTILSILNQTEKPFEIVISNNHSNDGDTDIVLEKYKNQIRVISPPSFLTMMENWNFLCKNLSGTHIALLSSDDYYEPNFVESFHKIVKPDGVLYRFGFNLVDDDNQVLKTRKINSAKKITSFPENFYEQIRSPKTSFAAFVVEKEALKKVNYFDENLKLIGDWGLWLRLSPLGKFYYSENIVSNYRFEYRPTLTKDRFITNVTDFVYVYGTLQREIIEKYHLKKKINRNSIKCHLYKFEMQRIDNKIEKPEILTELEKLVDYNFIKSNLEFKVRMYYQTIREHVFKR